MSDPASDVVVDTATIPDRSELSGDEVVSRVRRAFEHVGWTMVVEGG